ncbi:MAG: hypothetical protein JJU18_04395 [Oceanicaulis sp.]|nr:hypothetical protein [Oceanicaulis sp.]
MIVLKSLLAAAIGAAALLQAPYAIRISGDLILIGHSDRQFKIEITGAAFNQGEFGAPPASAGAGAAVLYVAEGSDLAALERALQSRAFSEAVLSVRTPDSNRRYELTGLTFDSLAQGGGGARDASARLNLRYQQVRSE